MDMHSLWRKIRRPFVYPRCVGECQWEAYDVTAAGCRKCGKQHICRKMVFEGDCPLFQNDDGSRVCCITGFIIPEVRFSKEEFIDTVVFKPSSISGVTPHVINNGDLSNEISKIVDRILDSHLMAKCRHEENSIQSKRIIKSFIKSIRLFKKKHASGLPNICDLLTQTLHQERKVSFIHPVSSPLKKACYQSVCLCIIRLKNKGFKICIGHKLQDLVCGLIYLLRTGISYNNLELLHPIPEIARCLPIESRLKTYFGINSKVITSVENEVKLAFRDHLQY
jgi:hypothetical protein